MRSCSCVICGAETRAAIGTPYYVIARSVTHTSGRTPRSAVRQTPTNGRSVGRSDLTHTGSVTQVTAPLDGQPNGRLRSGSVKPATPSNRPSLQRPPGAETGGKRQPSWPRAWRRIWMYTFAAPLDRALRIAADSCAVVCGDRREAYAEFGSRCRRLGGALRRLG